MLCRSREAALEWDKRKELPLTENSPCWFDLLSKAIWQQCHQWRGQVGVARPRARHNTPTTSLQIACRSSVDDCDHIASCQRVVRWLRHCTVVPVEVFKGQASFRSVFFFFKYSDYVGWIVFFNESVIVFECITLYYFIWKINK